jgi:16S rRNA (adenine1518-N6/adenine1519-N6)-dimethyltransferase
VAERLTTGPGSRDYGYLTVETQLHANAELLFTVPPGAFQPPPKVESAVVRLTPRVESRVDDTAAFLRFAGVCFQHKRKTLRNNLRSAYDAAQVDAVAEGGMRAEQLLFEQLVKIYDSLKK